MKQNIFSLDGKVTIVTGGKQGIGKVVAGYLADAGSDVVIVDMADASVQAEEIKRLSDASTYTSGADLLIDGCFTVV